MRNKKERDAGMRAFYVNPTSYNKTPKKPPGFEAAVEVQSENIPPSPADVSFQRDIKKARAITAEQQSFQKKWLEEHKASTAATQKRTHDKKLTNFRAREGVYQNNWHMHDTWPKLNQMTAPGVGQADISF